MNYIRYVEEHMFAHPDCALQKWDCCTCPYDPAVVKAIFAEAFSKLPIAQPPPVVVPEPVAPLPEDVVAKFRPYNTLIEFTLTTDKDDVYDLRQWFNKIVKSRMFEIKGYKACIELQANGNPHIHAMCFSTSAKVDASKIKKSLKCPWRYTFKKVRLPANFNTYLEKEKNNQVVANYCESKGVPQFWEELF